MTNPEETELQALARIIAQGHEAEARRDALLRKMARERKRGLIPRLAKLSGLAKTRVYQILAKPG